MKYKYALFVLLCMFNCKNFATNLTLESPAFKLNTMIPVEYTCEGTNKSPPLVWQNIPPKTKSLTLILEDPDAPNGTWTHWILFNIPPTVHQLDAGSSAPKGAVNGINSWGKLGYGGPCPPIGAHSYLFKLYALDTFLTLDESTTANKVLDAMTGHVLGSAVLLGLYQKSNQ
jgi:Raf kinase inhibitor-like YbhB/YbcL family protein